MRTRIKICCIASVAEARIAIDAGADALGFVSRMPSGPGPIDEGLISEITPAIPPGVASFLLTCETDLDTISAQVERCAVNTVQLVASVAPDVHVGLRRRWPGLRVVQVVHVEGERSLDQAARAAETADAILLDSGRPGAPIPELGGTGRVHDWALSERIVRAVGRPVYLAGGLHAGNVAPAIEHVRPFGVDVCSGVRTDGVLDAAKVREFVAAVWRRAEPQHKAPDTLS